ncbi:MAG: hypothetical protein M1838_001582 [Thelocarpon superellum]|nr:MAG: hypothetical protein M1838_001582 [Thelocarpon superellum]
MATSTVRIAILDDYLGSSTEPFTQLQKWANGRVETERFPDTLPAYSHPSTTATAKDDLIKRLRPFQVISTMRERTPFPAELLKQLPNLQLLLTTGPRNAAIDVGVASARGLIVAGTNYPVFTDPTAQHTWALILGITRGIAHDDAVVKGGGWQSAAATSLSGKTLALLGLGRLGMLVGKIGKAFDMNVIAWSSSLTQDAADEKAARCGLAVEDAEGRKTFKAVSKDELFGGADVLSVHYVLSERSKGVVGRSDLDKMQRTSFVVNTSRGPLIDEDALHEVLAKGRIKGAALDVFSIEPLPMDSPWRTTKWGQDGAAQVLLSPHMGYVETEVLHDWYVQNVENIKRWMEGQDVLHRL